jgi:trehalose 6-phosphate phosphatase
VTHQEKLEVFIRNPTSSGIFLDFDGTLSEIVHVPSEARPVEGVPETLAELGRRFAVVAVVSGRSAEELLKWLGPDVEIWGVHGAQRAVGGEVVLSERAAPYAELMSKVHADAAAALDDLAIEGTLIENKAVMVALHFRAAENVEAARSALDDVAEELATHYGLERAGGRLAFELRPPIELSKQSVVMERAREAELRAAMFVGDDRVDLPAFDALDELARAGVNTVRVGVDSTEAPPELLDRADIVVQGPSGVLDLLERLIR